MSEVKKYVGENDQILSNDNEYYTVWELNRYNEKSAKAIFDSLDWQWNNAVHFPWKKDSKFLLKWLNDNLKQLCEDWELTMKDWLTVYFDDDPFYWWYSIYEANKTYFREWELEEKYWEKWNFWDASHFDWRNERKLKIDDTWYLIYSR